MDVYTVLKSGGEQSTCRVLYGGKKLSDAAEVQRLRALVGSEWLAAQRKAA